MEIKFKKLDQRAVAPVRAHNTDAGFDLVATDITTEINECGQLILVYHTGIAVEIPEGYFGLLVPRSSVYKKSLMLTNHAGVIDSGYRGEIMGKFRSTTDVVPAVYKEGERFAQLLILPIPEFEVEEAQELTKTERGDGGYGSTNVSAATGSEEINAQQPINVDAESADDLQTATGASGGAINSSEVVE